MSMTAVCYSLSTPNYLLHKVDRQYRKNHKGQPGQIGGFVHLLVRNGYVGGLNLVTGITASCRASNWL
jgi:hypothetical protein